MIKLLLDALGFSSSNGWVESKRFDSIAGPVGSLRMASSRMNVKGAFGLWQTGAGSAKCARYVPLLYVAEAADATEAKKIHSQVWSQGLVPLLVISTNDAVYVSEGFQFSYDNWEASVTQVPWDRIEMTLRGADAESPLQRVHASRLSSALAWRDFALNPAERVDRRLLSTLTSLSRQLATQSGASIQASNALIGRFLYFYILRDRGLLTDQWLQRHDALEIFETRSLLLTTEKVWGVFDVLDDMLNGTIFPVAKKERAAFSNSDLQLLRDCIKLGDTLQADGVQLSFFDFSLGSLQTETLSAIYEQFLDSEDSEEKRLNGVFYTPPFLVDFVLDRVEDEIPLTRDRRVIDCTAGSGVFIVGAYRRIIESELKKSRLRSLPANELRDLLTNCIFGIEKNPSAHAVAAFSLYLTMLDYVAPSDIDVCLEGLATTPLFPPLSTQNLICADVFTLEAPDVNTKRFDVVVGNPPWQNIREITPHHTELTEQYESNVDSGESAEHTVWWAADNFLEPGGIAALVLPTKSLVGPSARRFPSALAAQTELVGVANFSHLRYSLFSHARQAACMLMVRGGAPRSRSSFWTYSPTRAHLLGPVDGDPWLITFDNSQVETHRQLELSRAADDDAWFNLIMLRPVDRYIKRYLLDTIHINRTASFGKLMASIGADLKRGGSPAQTGLPSNLLFGSDKFKGNDVRNAPGTIILREYGQLGLSLDSTISYDQSWLADTEDSFVRIFSGSCLLVPRSMVGLAYAQLPVAFNSSINAVFFTEPPRNATHAKKRQRLLIALGIFLESDVAHYLFALMGRLWILDRTRLEKSDLQALPVPFHGLDDPFIEEFLNTDESARTELVCSRFDLSVLLRGAVKEYLQFRKNFEDGQIPIGYGQTPNDMSIERYREALTFVLRPVLSDAQNAKVDVTNVSDASDRYVVTISFKTENKNSSSSSGTTNRKKVSAPLTDGMVFHYEPHNAVVTLAKPCEKFRWTVESAFSDGKRVIKELMEGSSAAA
ncbi:HsdM family class I SAM-dependent methyltransferase [Pandoraea commovens]|uniref:site-specific DNA-methyltransferase (adenine-specific) n=1 Tax=Pandoraea commovens TaxID=2508289 RepID=A0ABY5QH98_9BURK|nr:SAM-dependent methyltransferase [Pandoraea commovens]UVA79989.1 SAM-dependent methyltransferase [Pandoraea commovens]